jgi:pimeloyl-ACP methyl ester carboxylesterase
MQTYFPNWRDEFDKFVENYVRIKNGPDYEAFSMTSVRTYQMIAAQPVVRDFPKIQQPTLLIIGQLDHTVFGKRFAPPEAVKTMGDFTKLGQEVSHIIKNSRLVEIDNVGHVPHLEVHDVFMDKLVEFLN